MAVKEVIDLLIQNNLKITPQRIAVLEVLRSLRNHPDAESIMEHLRKKNPHLTTGTVYKILDIFTEKGIIKRVKTDSGHMRYDPVQEKHHHLYSVNSGRIEDYFDEDLDMIIEKYLKNKKIPNFTISDFKLNITGTFTNKKSS